MGSHNTKSAALHSAASASTQLFDDWFDPIETDVRAQVRSFIEGMIEAEPEAALSRPRYGRPAKARDGADRALAAVSGHRHGDRPRSLMGTFGRVEISVPRARLTAADGKTSEWKSKTLSVHQRVEVPIESAQSPPADVNSGSARPATADSGNGPK